MKFLEGPPAFAVEVRSDNDYGPAEELAMVRSVRTISRPARKSFGMSIRSRMSFARILAMPRIRRHCSSLASPTPSRPCQV